MSFFPWIFDLAVDVEAWPGGPWFPLLWVIIVDPFFITNDYTMQKTLSFMPGKQHFTCEKSAFNVSRFQFIWNPIPLLLNHSQWFQMIWNCLLNHFSCKCKFLWHESSSNNASNSASSYIFGLPLRSLSSMSNSSFLNFLKPLTTTSLT